VNKPNKIKRGVDIPEIPKYRRRENHNKIKQVSLPNIPKKMLTTFSQSEEIKYDPKYSLEEVSKSKPKLSTHNSETVTIFPTDTKSKKHSESLSISQESGSLSIPVYNSSLSFPQIFTCSQEESLTSIPDHPSDVDYVAAHIYESSCRHSYRCPDSGSVPSD
jgi:hypothetical protein